MSFLEGQEFTVPQPAGVNVVAFLVNETSPEKWDTLPLYMLDKLECTQFEENGKVLKTFSVPTDEDELNIIVLSLAKNRCVIGHGKLHDNQFIADSETVHLQYTNMGEIETEEKEFTFKYNPKRQIVIIDAETGEQVIPRISKDEVTQRFNGKYKLVPYKNYVAMELAIKFSNPPFSGSQKMSPSMEDIANMKI